MAPIGVVWRLLVVGAGVAVGIVAARSAYPPWQVFGWVGDLLTGWALIAVGLLGIGRGTSPRVGTLLVLAGFSWFLGDFAAVGGPAGTVAGATTFLHRGFIMHAVFTSPTGRASTHGERVAVTLGYVASLIPWIWSNLGIAIAASVLAFTASAVMFARAPGLLRRPKRRALEACALLTGSIIAGFAIRPFWDSVTGSAVALVAYEVGLVLAAVFLVGGAWVRTESGADLVVEFGANRGGGLEDALRWALGDPGLRLGYPTAVPGDFLDRRGDPLGECHLVNDADGRPIAGIQESPGSLADPELLDSVGDAVRLDAANRELRARVAAQVDAVRASQQRLIRAADDEDRRLGERLRESAGARLLELSQRLDAASRAAVHESTRSGIGDVRKALDHADEDLGDLARGLNPRGLVEAGLPGAITTVVQESVIPVEMSIDPMLALPADIELAVYFFCLEALTNTAKHASATRVRIVVGMDAGMLHLEVTDDGIGGATFEGGLGLSGVADRIRAFGGTVRLMSDAGRGTSIVADVPIRAESLSRSVPTDDS